MSLGHLRIQKRADPARKVSNEKAERIERERQLSCIGEVSTAAALASQQKKGGYQKNEEKARE